MNSMDNSCVGEYWKNFETNKILLGICEKINKINDAYYKEIHIYINKLYNCNSKSLLKLKTTSICLTTETLINYNDIIKKYNLKKNLFDVDKFDVNEIYDFNCIIDIAVVITNNLLDKINYKMIKSNRNNKVKLFIKKNSDAK